MQKNKLRYFNYEIVFQEVPNEVSLAFNITNCQHRCEGCHSNFLWDDVGNYLDDDLNDVIKKYKGMITCVALMGGDHNLSEMGCLLKRIQNKFKLKTCLYTGLDDTYSLIDVIPHLNYLKIGHFDLNLGGLDSPNTNQIFYKNEDGNLIDFTYLFQKKGIE